jgi:hypothetical protein
MCTKWEVGGQHESHTQHPVQEISEWSNRGVSHWTADSCLLLPTLAYFAYNNRYYTIVSSAGGHTEREFMGEKRISMDGRKRISLVVPLFTTLFSIPKQ